MNDMVKTDHFLSYGIVCSLKVEQHLSDDGLHVASATHGIEQIHGTLTHADVTLRLATSATLLHNNTQETSACYCNGLKCVMKSD